MLEFFSAGSLLRSFLSLQTSPFRNRRWTVNKLYYTPSEEEFHIGFRYEILKKPLRQSEAWYQEVFSGYSGDEGSLSEIHNISNKTDHKEVRVQHLHAEDFKEMNISCERVPNSIGVTGERYLCEAMIDHPREKNPVSLKIYFAPLTNWTMITIKEHVVFAGTTMNISELKRTLKRIQGDAIVTGK